MYQKLKTTNAKGVQLKQHHHVNLSVDFIQDCLMWRTFLQTTDLQICRPFADQNREQDSEILSFYSDASKNPSLGMGAVFQDCWIVQKWDANFVRDTGPNIKFLELYTLTAALITWTSSGMQSLNNNKVIIFCDNQAMIAMVNNYATSCKQCRKLIQIIALCGIHYNLCITV